MPLFDPENPKDRLLATAAHLFRKQGFSRTTVRDISAALGQHSGSLFHHVRSKDELLDTIMARIIAAMNADLKKALSRAETPADRLRALISVELTALHGPDADATAVLFHEWRLLTPDRQAPLLAGRRDYFSQWDAVLADAARQGLISATPSATRQFLHGALAWTSFWFDPSGPLSLSDLTEQALTMLMRQTDHVRAEI